jgi:hypothetical protein
MVTSADLPFSRLVTFAFVPSGSVLLAAAVDPVLNVSPLAIFLPWKLLE